MARHAIAVSAAILIACAGPAGSDDANADSVAASGVHPVLLALMDSAAAEYRNTDFERALGHYQTAARFDTTLAAPWFGLFLTHHALGQAEAADSAFSRARRLAQRE